MTDTQPVTELLLELRSGGADAVDRLYPLVYDELRRIAGRAFRGERSDHTLGTTGLVHEAYLRLADQTRLEYRDRVHFYAVAANAVVEDLVRLYRSRGEEEKAEKLEGLLKSRR